AFWNGACGTTDVVKPKPSIQINPGAVAFKDTIGSASPPAQSVAVSTDGQGPVSGLRADVTYGSGAPGWLTVALSDTMAPATLTITGTAAGNNPQTVAVTYAIAPPPPITGVTIVLTANLGRCGSELAQETAKVIAAANPSFIFMMGTSVYPSTGTVTTLQDYM